MYFKILFWGVVLDSLLIEFRLSKTLVIEKENNQMKKCQKYIVKMYYQNYDYQNIHFF